MRAVRIVGLLGVGALVALTFPLFARAVEPDTTPPSFAFVNARVLPLLPGETLTVTFTLSEKAVSNPTVMVNGVPAAHYAHFFGNGTTFNYSYVIHYSLIPNIGDGTNIHVVITATDLAGNTGQAEWPEPPPPSVPSVLFIPGMKASRLYENDNGVEQRRWEPDYQADAEALYLDQNGTSVRPIYTKSDATISEIDVPFFGGDIYRTFFEQLAELKGEGTIADYRIFPYDWRMSPEDVAEYGAPYADGMYSLAEVVSDLGAGGNKVIIAGHSNGGLVAKALMRKLEREGNADLVSKVIFVATPQLGTSEAVAAMLHGDFQGVPRWPFGFIVSKANARALGENMPDAYALLPSREYFGKVANPVVDFSEAPMLQATAGVGSIIDNFAGLAQFLTGPARPKPSYGDIETPNLLSSGLLSEADALHNNLDAWVPPSGVDAIQIVGWGLDTPKSISYVERVGSVCTLAGCISQTNLRHVVNMTEDGDKIVVDASAIGIHDWPTYYINIKQYNADTDDNDHGHSNITEIQPFQNLFSLIVATTSQTNLPAYTSTSTLLSSGEKRLRLRVFSPVSLDAYDSEGRHTGLVASPIPGSDLRFKEEEIPNSYYEEYGEGKYLGLPTDDTITVKLQGLDIGTFTFEASVISGDTVESTTSFGGIPVTASTTATFVIPSDSVSDLPLLLDNNGDDITDSTIVPGGEIEDPLVYLESVESAVQKMDLGKKTKRELLQKLEDLADKKTTSKLLKDLDRLTNYLGKELAESKKKANSRDEKPKGKPKDDSRISAEQVQLILNMLAHFRTLIL